MRFSIVVLLATAAVSISTQTTLAEEFSGESGVSSDDFPDFYYDVNTGIASFDSDGTDMIALLWAGPDPDLKNNCLICGSEPIVDPVTMTTMFYTVDYLAAGSVWTRLSPNSGPGLQGFFDLVAFEAGMDSFPAAYFDAMNNAWQVTYATGANDVYYSNVTFVPEPTSVGFLSLLALIRVIRNHSEFLGRPGSRNIYESTH